MHFISPFIIIFWYRTHRSRILPWPHRRTSFEAALTPLSRASWSKCHAWYIIAGLWPYWHCVSVLYCASCATTWPSRLNTPNVRSCYSSDIRFRYYTILLIPIVASCFAAIIYILRFPELTFRHYFIDVFIKYRSSLRYWYLQNVRQRWFDCYSSHFSK